MGAEERLTQTHEPTDETRRQVAFMCAAGIDQAGICYQLGLAGTRITAKTLRRHYKADLANGYASITYRMARRLVEKADAGDLAAIMFYLERRGGWRRLDNLALANADHQPLAMAVSFRWADAVPQAPDDSDQPTDTRDAD